MNVKQTMEYLLQKYDLEDRIVGHLLQKYNLEERIEGYDSYGIKQEINRDNIDELLRKEGERDE